MSEKKPLVRVGKRKTAVARAFFKQGSGRVTVNNYPIEQLTPEVARMKVMEPISLAGEKLKNVDIKIHIQGGGVIGQAEAARMAIAKGLVDWTKSSELKRIFQSYDRTMLSGDSRRTEPKKFGGPGARTRKQKSYR